MPYCRKSFESVIFSNEYAVICKRLDITDSLTANFPVIKTRFNSNDITLVNLLTNKTQYIVILENVNAY